MEVILRGSPCNEDKRSIPKMHCRQILRASRHVAPSLLHRWGKGAYRQLRRLLYDEQRGRVQRLVSAV